MYFVLVLIFMTTKWLRQCRSEDSDRQLPLPRQLRGKWTPILPFIFIYIKNIKTIIFISQKLLRQVYRDDDDDIMELLMILVIIKWLYW